MARLSLTINFITLLIVAGQPVNASQFSAELKVQHLQAYEPQTNAVGDHYGVTTGSLRVVGRGQQERFSWQAHYLIEGAFSDRLRALSPFNGPNGATNPLDLEDTLDDGRYGVLNHRIDRLWLSYSRDDWVFKMGRQAITWGSGRLFRPMDLFNPFSSTALDTSYKPGIDMLYAQYLYPDGGDLQLLYVPRRDRESGERISDDSAIAAKRLWFDAQRQYQMLLAQDYEDWVFAASLAQPVAEALFSTDVVQVWTDSGDYRWSVVANLDYSWSAFGRPFSGFIEIFRNGYGGDSVPVSELNPLLREKQQRPQLFNTGSAYLAGGVSAQQTALTTLGSTLIFNLNDRSALLGLSLDHNLSDDARLIMGSFLPMGPKGTEYGGLKATENSTTLVRLPPQVFLRLEWFF